MEELAPIENDVVIRFGTGELAQDGYKRGENE